MVRRQAASRSELTVLDARWPGNAVERDTKLSIEKGSSPQVRGQLSTGVSERMPSWMLAKRSMQLLEELRVEDRRQIRSE